MCAPITSSSYTEITSPSGFSPSRTTKASSSPHIGVASSAKISSPDYTSASASKVTSPPEITSSTSAYATSSPSRIAASSSPAPAATTATNGVSHGFPGQFSGCCRHACIKAKAIEVVHWKCSTVMLYVWTAQKVQVKSVKSDRYRWFEILR
ncbi:hypothetical protein EW026_g4911 [Hermanssonia centrifuga]|uniref:Uncharacterized protein n=1 Tax=Hermanssonia centrifuga TaxID=98765 RepID=A0A4S4KK73_9APHY|nr:hypothetical protein EW026_g4911 [Hermanssonia centrifuga]